MVVNTRSKYAGGKKPSTDNCSHRDASAHSPSSKRRVMQGKGFYRDNTAFPSNKPPCHKKLALSDLECVRSLGKGGFGKVVLVRVRHQDGGMSCDEGPSSLFAVKVFKKITIQGLEQDDPHDAHCERLYLANFPWSPWIDGMVTALHDDPNLYIMLELMPYGSLSDLLRERGPFDDRTACFYFANIVCGLDFMHSHGIIHRDFKPSNILVGADGYLSIADFGYSSKEVGGAQTWHGVGTPLYMAPELFIEGQLFGPAIDWWASGVILYELFTDKHAFRAKKEDETITRILTLRYHWPTEKYVDKVVKSLVASLLIPLAKDRLGTRGSHEIKAHRWFQNIDWHKMQDRVYTAPWIPPEHTLTQQWCHKPLPGRKSVPGLSVLSPPLQQRYDIRNLFRIRGV